MNNDNSSKLLIHKKEEKEVIYDQSIKQSSIKRNSKPKFDLNLSDYFKLIKHKKVPNAVAKKYNNIIINKKGSNNKNQNESNKTSKNSSKSNRKKSKEKIIKKTSKNNSEKKKSKKEENK